MASTTMEVERWMLDSAEHATGTTPASIPLATPTFSPMGSNRVTTNSNELGQAQTALMSLLVFFIMMVTLVCFVAYMNCTNRRNPDALPRDASMASETQQRRDLVRRMSPEDRKAYVANFLKTQKFEETDTFIRRKKMRSSKELPFQKENDEDVEANLSTRSNGVSYPSCAICLDPFRKGEDVCSAQNKLCPHEFHLNCIFPWLLKSQECPCCRRDYLCVDQDAMDLYLRESASQNLSSTLHSI